MVHFKLYITQWRRKNGSLGELFCCWHKNTKQAILIMCQTFRKPTFRRIANLENFRRWPNGLG